jgi:hypothetical protein
MGRSKTHGMEKPERLALAVRATVAQTRFEDAKASEAAPRLGDEAIAAARALARAWRAGPPDLLEWIGCTDEEYRRAVEAALAEERHSRP